jgi:flagellar hook-associated protein FlgK
MQNYSIGLSGLNAAYAALDSVGNNIANASTEGYHRQRVDFQPAGAVQSAGLSVGGGVAVAGLRRMVDQLLEGEIVRQESSYAQVSQELSTLSSVEIGFGEFGAEGGLNETIDAFFDALRGLAAHPLENVWRNATVSAGQVLASEFRRLGTSLSAIEDQIVMEARNTTDSINQLVNQIAEVNGKIQTVEISGGQANNLRDRRDQLIVELARLARVETQARDYGVVDVSMAGLPVVTGAISVEIAVRLGGDNSLEIHAAGSSGAGLHLDGGRMGGLLTLKNELLVDLRHDLNTLARGIIAQINEYHVQAVGMDGAFSELSGWLMGSDDLSQAEMPIADGTFYVRVTDTNTGAVTRQAIDVDLSGPVPDTLTSVVAKMDAITGLNASAGGSQVRLVADLGYTFDFIPAVLPEPTVSNLTAVSPPTISVAGIYSEDVNETFTFTVAGSGAVGNGNLRLDVTNGAGDVVATLNIGAGYAAGDSIELSHGVNIAVSTGNLNDGDDFQVDVLAATDTSGFLMATGLNTFFSGSGASDMAVCTDVANDPDRIATAIGHDLSDNVAALRLSSVQDEPSVLLEELTPNEYYQRLIAGVGQEVALKESRQANIEAMMANLSQQRSEISGVNINDEAAALLVFEKTFQAVAKYLNSLQSAMVTLMDIM